jgi:IclR family acetate operon transcriptional repressor
VQTARRALDLLRLVVNSDESLGLSELSRRSGLNKATTYRLMQLFEEYAYVAREDGGRSYVTGPGLVGLAAVVLGRLDIARAARPVVSRLAEATGETASLHIPRHLDRVCIGGAESAHLLRRTVAVGHVASLLQGVTGRVLLAHMEPRVVAAVLTRAAEVGESVGEVEQELAAIRSAGYSAQIEPRDGGMVGALAVPIFRAGGIAAAITMAGPADRWNLAAMKAALPLVLRESRELSAELGSSAEAIAVAAGGTGQ